MLFPKLKDDEERVLHDDRNTIFLSLQIYKDSLDEKLSSKTYCDTNGTAFCSLPSPCPVDNTVSTLEVKKKQTGLVLGRPHILKSSDMLKLLGGN